MSRGRHLDVLTSLSDMPSLSQHLAEKEKVDGEAAGDCDSPCRSDPGISDRRVSAHHDDRARPVTYGDGLDRDVLRCQIHHQGAAYRRRRAGRK